MGGVVSRYNAEPAPEFCGLSLTRGMSRATGVRGWPAKQARRTLTRSPQAAIEIRAGSVVKVRDTSRDTVSLCKILKFCHFLPS